MAQYSLWILGESNITISNGAVLDGVTQGDATHLLGESITLNNASWQEVLIDDSEAYFADSDSSQTLDGDQVIDGVLVSGGTRVEAEYQIVVSDGTNTYTLVGFNENSTSPSYGTVEGLAFIGGPGGFPPIGVPLSVVSVSEGPAGSSTLYADYATPICLTTGAMLATPDGPVAVQDLAIGDLVNTLDHGARAIRWIGCIKVGRDRLLANPAFWPVRIKQHALGPGLPDRDMLVSQQHRLLIRDLRAEILFGEAEVLVAAKHLINDSTIRMARDVTAVTYYHLMFDDHEILFSDGVETESFLPGPQAISAIPTAAKQELFALFPQLEGNTDTYGLPARRMLSGREGRIIARA